MLTRGFLQESHKKPTVREREKEGASTISRDRKDPSSTEQSASNDKRIPRTKSP